MKCFGKPKLFKFIFVVALIVYMMLLSVLCVSGGAVLWLCTLGSFKFECALLLHYKLSPSLDEYL